MKKIVSIIIIVAMCFLCCGCSSYNPVSFIKRKTGVDVKGCRRMVDYNDHDGFHGDGEHFIAYDCSAYAESIEEQVDSWKDLPLTENIHIALYGAGWYVGEGSSTVAGRYDLPEEMNGKYMFIDRHYKATDPSDDSGLFDDDRYSFDYTVAIFDTDNKMFYYYDFDT